MQAEELRELDAEELGGRLKGARRDLFELRFKLAVGQLENPHQIGTVRREIARILTVVHERLLDEQVEQAYGEAAPIVATPPAETTADTPEQVEASGAETEAEPAVDETVENAHGETAETDDAETAAAETDETRADEAKADDAETAKDEKHD